MEVKVSSSSSSISKNKQSDRREDVRRKGEQSDRREDIRSKEEQERLINLLSIPKENDEISMENEIETFIYGKTTQKFKEEKKSTVDIKIEGNIVIFGPQSEVSKGVFPLIKTEVDEISFNEDQKEFERCFDRSLIVIAGSYASSHFIKVYNSLYPNIINREIIAIRYNYNDIDVWITANKKLKIDPNEFYGLFVKSTRKYLTKIEGTEHQISSRTNKTEYNYILCDDNSPENLFDHFDIPPSKVAFIIKPDGLIIKMTKSYIYSIITTQIYMNNINPREALFNTLLNYTDPNGNQEKSRELHLPSIPELKKEIELTGIKNISFDLNFDFPRGKKQIIRQLNFDTLRKISSLSERYRKYQLRNFEFHYLEE